MQGKKTKINQNKKIKHDRFFPHYLARQNSHENSSHTRAICCANGHERRRAQPEALVCGGLEVLLIFLLTRSRNRFNFFNYIFSSSNVSAGCNNIEKNFFSLTLHYLYFSGFSGFSPYTKANTSKFQFDRE